ncbi:MAG: SBBP repeat-containing protein [Anaerolineales bacterium]|nr:SBBP repeat-containing protein [Anaerolineales bacterium]
MQNRPHSAYSFSPIGRMLLVFVIMAAAMGCYPQKPQSSLRVVPPLSLGTNHTASANFGHALGAMPLYFVENGGQVDDQVAFTLQGHNQTVYFTSQGITFALTRPVRRPSDDSYTFTSDRQLGLPKASLRSDTSNLAYSRWAVKLDFVGANLNVRPVGQERLETIVSYFKDSHDKWHTALKTYQEVIYHNLWSGIDLRYYADGNILKYEFVVAPGADPDQIRLSYRGASSVLLNASGQLEVDTPLGGFTDDTPTAYQVIDDRQVNVAMSYRFDWNMPSIFAQHDSNEKQPQSFSFRLGTYDPMQPLVLDPAILLYGGYIGGVVSEQAFAVDVSAADNAFVVGETNSDADADFPVRAGPDLTYNGDMDAFVAKLNSAGSALIYLGYIGGSGYDGAYGVAVDVDGNAYVAGGTSSDENSFPTVVGPDLTFNGVDDAFVVKINATGDGLLYSGYIGGEYSDGANAIAIDAIGNAYVTGIAGPSELTFPELVGPDLTGNGGFDAFVSKVNAGGTALDYSGYIGGSSMDYALGIAVDSAGNAYVTGQSLSPATTFPFLIAPDSTQDTTGNGGWLAFVAKITPSGTGLSYVGFLGSRYGIGSAIAVDAYGNAYITGQTAVVGEAAPVGWINAFVVKVNSTGTALVYSIDIGGDNGEWGHGIAIDDAGGVFVTGSTWSDETTFPVRSGPDLVYNGNSDAFVAKVNSTGTDLIYAGYLGGSGVDDGYGIAVDKAGNAYAVGTIGFGAASFSGGGPDLAFKGNVDGFVAKVSNNVSVLKPWTLMFYLDGDNNLDETYPPIFNQLEAAADNPNVNIVVVWDRAGNDNSTYYHVQYDTNLNNLATYTDSVNRWPQVELNMGDPGTVSNLAIWAQSEFPAEHYALILSDHGSGLVGAMQDDTNGGDILTLPELGTALSVATNSGASKIDVLYLDVCSMAMIEDAYQVRNYADFYIASANLQFSFDTPYRDYISGITADTTPIELASIFVEAYALAGETESLPYTISAADLSELSPLVNSVNSLATALSDRLITDGAYFAAVQNAVQRYEMSGDFNIDSNDSYIDLYDFAQQVDQQFLDTATRTAAQHVMDKVDSYIVANRVASGAYEGETWLLDNSHGVSIFFPPWRTSFYNAANYDFAVGADWFTNATYLPETDSGAATWGEFLVDHFEVLQPGGSDHPIPPPILERQPPAILELLRVFLPFVRR